MSALSWRIRLKDTDGQGPGSHQTPRESVCGEIMPAFLVRTPRPIGKQRSALVHLLSLNCGACREFAGIGHWHLASRGEDHAPGNP